MKAILLFLLSFSLLMSACSANPNFEYEGIKYGDCIIACKNYGIDYEKLFVSAKKGEHKALVTLMKLSKSGVFDGSAAGANRKIIWYLFIANNKDSFSKAYNSLSQGERQFVKKLLTESLEDKLSKK